MLQREQFGEDETWAWTPSALFLSVPGAEVGIKGVDVDPFLGLAFGIDRY